MCDIFGTGPRNLVSVALQLTMDDKAVSTWPARVRRRVRFGSRWEMANWTDGLLGSVCSDCSCIRLKGSCSLLTDEIMERVL